MSTIRLVELRDDTNYFSLIHEGNTYNSCRRIANFFNLPAETYNQLLIEKVIKHSNYEVYFCNVGNEKVKDIIFYLNHESKETYIKRFIEVFAPQLMLLRLEGETIDNN